MKFLSQKALQWLIPPPPPPPTPKFDLFSQNVPTHNIEHLSRLFWSIINCYYYPKRCHKCNRPPPPLPKVDYFSKHVYNIEYFSISPPPCPPKVDLFSLQTHLFRFLLPIIKYDFHPKRCLKGSRPPPHLYSPPKVYFFPSQTALIISSIFSTFLANNQM